MLGKLHTKNVPENGPPCPVKDMKERYRITLRAIAHQDEKTELDLDLIAKELKKYLPEGLAIEVYKERMVINTAIIDGTNVIRDEDAYNSIKEGVYGGSDEISHEKFLGIMSAPLYARCTVLSKNEGEIEKKWVEVAGSAYQSGKDRLGNISIVNTRRVKLCDKYYEYVGKICAHEIGHLFGLRDIDNFSRLVYFKRSFPFMYSVTHKNCMMRQIDTIGGKNVYKQWDEHLRFCEDCSKKIEKNIDKRLRGQSASPGE